MITSPQNEQVKQWVRLRKDGNVRREAGAFFIEGRAAVWTALASGPVRQLIISPHLFGERDETIVARARAAHIDVIEVGAHCFKKIADTKNPQGIAAVVPIPEPSPDAIAGKDALVVVCCGIADPGNLGTIVRTADAAGATAVVALPPSADLYNAKVVRSSAASLLHLPVMRMEEEAFLVAAAGMKIIAAAARGGVPPAEADWSRPVAIAIGSEAHGLPPGIIAAAATSVTIPIRGEAESLNAAVAAGILIYEAVRTPG